MPVSASFQDSGQVMVCCGDVHPFPVPPRETFRELLQRAAKRFAVDPYRYELQDSDYSALELDAPVLSQGHRIFRLTQKTDIDPLFRSDMGE